MITEVASTPTSAVSRRVSSSSSRSSSMAFLPRNRLAMPSPMLALVLDRPCLRRVKKPALVSSETGLAGSAATGSATATGAGATTGTTTGAGARTGAGAGAETGAGASTIGAMTGAGTGSSTNGSGAATSATRATGSSATGKLGQGSCTGVATGASTTGTLTGSASAATGNTSLTGAGVASGVACGCSTTASCGFLRSQPNRLFFSPAGAGVFLSSLEPNMEDGYLTVATRQGGASANNILMRNRLPFDQIVRAQRSILAPPRPPTLRSRGPYYRFENE